MSLLLPLIGTRCVLPADPLMPDAAAAEPHPARASSSLYVLERFVNIMTYRPLLHNLLLALFGCGGLPPAAGDAPEPASTSCRSALQVGACMHADMQAFC